MKSPLLDRSPRVSRKLALATLCIVAIATTVRTRAAAAAISELEETPTSLSFNFSGTDFFSQFLSVGLPSLTYWNVGSDVHSFNFATDQFGFTLIARHLPDGASVQLGGGLSGALGDTLFDSGLVAHGDGFDLYALDVTVQNDGNDGPGAFSGSFLAAAAHTAAGVPDSGSAVLLLSISFLSLFGISRRLASH
jgi:hypothetical protein